MAYTFLTTLLGAALVVKFVLGYSFIHQPLILLSSALPVQLILAALWVIWLAPKVSPLRTFPLAPQGPWWKTFLLEPQPYDLERYMRSTPNNGLIRYFGVLHGERLLITKPQGTKDMLLLQPYNFNKLALTNKLIGHFTGRGIVVVDQDEHKRQRKSMAPAFKFKHIKNLFPKFWFHATRLVHALENHADRTTEKSAMGCRIDVDNWLMRTTLDVVASAGFGINVNATQAPDNELARLLPLVMTTSSRANFYRLLGFLLPEWLYFRLPMERRFEIDRVKKALHNVTMPLIQARKVAISHQETHDPEAGHDKNGGDFADTDVIATLLRLPHPPSDEELLAQSATIMVAGQDTTSVATTWALYLLAHHTNIQATLRHEVQTHLPSPDSKTESVDAPLVESLPYLAAVCSETLRLFPPAPILRRQVTKPGTTILGEHIPVGTKVATSIWGTHHSESIWGPDADQFKPERFLRQAENGKSKFDPHGGLQGEAATYSFLPFGAGVRSCIGERFARAEFAILLAVLVGKFDWTLTNPKAKLGDDVVLNFGLVTKPQGGLSLMARRIEGW
ncbi:hypothetical protein LTR47_003059 [Exophiala xenobiotica]|nr:hypothetical protein LTR47_003059 [Exophiala xenobiotica]KAK5252941.1 hypothetical protein LTS06_002653 [Exophiala xenobiotica]KAK5353818.1 hypothetical protein LTR61_002512 [Exophiala xenobiotica]KAK5366715.1 hypothetical protein LTS03_008628 [Exophiala xenobiotica]KAK5370627.1 hypothetical protein LTR11_006838 [Exophiala xenobiotica]